MTHSCHWCLLKQQHLTDEQNINLYHCHGSCCNTWLVALESMQCRFMYCALHMKQHSLGEESNVSMAASGSKNTIMIVWVCGMAKMPSCTFFKVWQATNHCLSRENLEAWKHADSMSMQSTLDRVSSGDVASYQIVQESQTCNKQPRQYQLPGYARL